MIKSKHNQKDLSKAYVKSCKTFFLTLDDKERIKRDNENIKRIDAQTRYKK